MLVLSRRRQESIVINENIVITIVKIRGNQVHLGFEAPRDAKIHRQEIYDAIAERREEEETPANVRLLRTIPA